MADTVPGDVVRRYLELIVEGSYKGRVGEQAVQRLKRERERRLLREHGKKQADLIHQQSLLLRDLIVKLSESK